MRQKIAVYNEEKATFMTFMVFIRKKLCLNILLSMTFHPTISDKKI